MLRSRATYGWFQTRRTWMLRSYETVCPRPVGHEEPYGPMARWKSERNHIPAMCMVRCTRAFYGFSVCFWPRDRKNPHVYITGTNTCTCGNRTGPWGCRTNPWSRHTGFGTPVRKPIATCRDCPCGVRTGFGTCIFTDCTESMRARIYTGPTDMRSLKGPSWAALRAP